MQHPLDLHLLIDRSGSMSHLAATVVTEANLLVDRIATDAPAATVTVATFDSTNPFHLVRDRVPARHFLPILRHEYRPGGGTPLLDALGALISGATHVAHADRQTGQRRQTVLAVMTDGEENDSHRYDHATIAGKLARRRAAGWRLLYLGPGSRQGALIGFHPAEIQPWEATHAGTGLAFQTIADLTLGP